jgi:hypothetical protein
MRQDFTFGSRFGRRLRAFGRAEAGTTLPELAIVVALMLAMVFALIDFGRLAYARVATEKALQRAVRVAAVRPPACAGVPDHISRGPVATGGTPPRYGTPCRDGATICADPGNFVCTGNAGNATAVEIWGILQPVLPGSATISDLQVRYDHDDDLGFLGGPYVPVVTVSLTGVDFTFATAFGGFAAAAAGLTGTTLPDANDTVPYPDLSVSIPGEDLASGTDG